jgi:alpha-1,6-mannosyltransferase
MKLSQPSRPTLLLIAGLSAVVYLLIFGLPFPLSQYYNTIPPVDYSKLTHYSVGGVAAYVVGLALLFGLYLWALRLVMPKNDEASPLAIGGRFVIVTGAALAALLLFSYPVDAIDVFVYAIYTRGWGLYGLNPLATAPAQFPANDPWVGLAAEWASAPSPYGPVWQVLALGAYFAGGDFLRQVYALKVLLSLAYLGSATLIYLILKQRQPRWAVAGTIAFAWNPLVLLEVAQNGHNDIVMIFFLLAAVWALLHSSHPERSAAKSKDVIYLLLVCLFLALSILTKFITIVVVPFFLLALMMRGQRWPDRIARLIGSSLLIGALVVIGRLPLWPGWETWALVQGADSAGRSILALIILSVKDLIGLETAFPASRLLLWAIFAPIYLYCLWRMIAVIRRDSSKRREAIETQTIASSFLTLFWLLLLMMPLFHAWYIVWSFPLAVLLLPERRALIASIVFTLSALLVVPYFETVHV